MTKNKVCGIASKVLSESELKNLRKKTLGERHVIMQRRADACMKKKKMK